MPQFLPVTCFSATLMLAYCQHYTCKFLSGRCFSNTHLRQMAAWLSCPPQSPRSLRQHPTLAAHITLLHAAGLLNHNQVLWYLTPDVFPWLEQPVSTQCAELLAGMADGRWAAIIEQYQLTDILTIDVVAYIQQQLLHQVQQVSPPMSTWLAGADRNTTAL